ncbi:MAG: amidohydrolase family protein [Bacteroidota bacterium]|nr:amidohydrolase family protein [Bacteroidota bacterium]MDP4212256.1 amidohydrolase family protein [Bacteroidota bacterium]MDP4251372.1 amidohydrolase family protein [Bacteroidota bacterium]
MTIDAEVHFWKYGKNTGNQWIRNNKILQENLLPSQLSLNLQRNQVAACIAVAAEPAEVETRFLAELALTHPVISGVIGWIDLLNKNAAEKIRELSSYTAIRGFKLDTDGEDLASVQPVMELLAQYGYALDLKLSSNTNTDQLHGWLRSFPDQYFVLDHCGNPDTKHPPSTEWIRQIQQLAKNQNLSCKVCGLFTAGNWKSWKPADFYPFLDILFEAFGANRLLYASDWPFILLSGSYVQWKSLLEKYSDRLSEEERERFFGENARHIYRL